MRMLRVVSVTAMMLVAGAAYSSGRAVAASLWKGDYAATSSFFTDHKARSVHDIITVLISEEATATRTATTSTGRETTAEGGIESWFKVDNVLGILKGLFSSQEVKAVPAGTANLPAWKIDAKHDYKGTGNTLRNDKFEAKVTCLVVEVLPNNNLVIEGRQNVTVNTEEQTIVLRGVIRPEDVNADNEVYSYNVADASIIYAGKGPLGDKQKRGFVEWIGDVVWPF